MFELLQMWALVEVLGFICLPLTVTVFHNLPDRGWAFSKALGIALLAFCIWLPLMYFHVLPFSQLFIAGVLLVILAFSLLGFAHTRQAILKLVRVNFIYIAASEIVFLGMVFLLGWIRSYVPDIHSFEMFMDEGFIAAIMRSPHFPPNDMWLSGYPINYYYYAHFTIAALAKLLGQSPSIAFNTGICIFYGLTAINLFGVTCNIVSWARHQRAKASSAGTSAAPPDTVYPSLFKAIPYGLLTMLMGQVLGNLAATQQWWRDHGDWSTFDGWRLPLTLGTTALILGGLFTMNGWDFPTYLGLTIVCIALQQWLAHQSRLSVELALNVFIAVANVSALSFLLYVPFYISFISPAQGLGIVNPADRSPLGNEVLIYGMFAFVFLSLLLASALKRRLALGSTNETPDSSGASPPINNWRKRLGIVSLLLVIVVELIAFVSLRNSATLVVAGIITMLGIAAVLYQLRDRPRAFTLLLGTVAFALVAGCEVFFLRDVFAGNFPRMNTVFKFYFQAWALLSISSGAGVYFILESFRPAAILSRIQHRIQLDDGSELVEEEIEPGRAPRWQYPLPRLLGAVWSVALLALLLAGAVYPLVGTYARTDHYAHRTNSLDGLAYLQTCHPLYCDYDSHGDYAAISWLNSHVSGDPIIVEAVGPDYSSYGRISTFTGLPTPMGWVGHEYQWRVNWLNKDYNSIDFSRRAGDIDSIYTDQHPAVVLALMARYHAQYLYVGLLEREKYPTANLQRFSAFMQVVYSADGVMIYMVR